MKTGILLVTLPPWGIETPPLGLACLSTHLRSNGFNAQVFDFNIYFYNKVDKKYKYLWEMGNALYWRDKEPFDRIVYPILNGGLGYCVDKILSSGVEAVGFSVLSVSQNLITAEIIKKIKKRKPEIKIILGGISVSVDEQREFFEQNLIGLIDSYVIGEGEGPLVNILGAYRKGAQIEGIPGVLTYRNGKRLYTPNNLKENLDMFSYPLFEEFNLDAYTNKSKGLIMEWSRGCIGNCSFCAFKAISGKFRNKSISSILEALSYYKKKYAAEYFSLVDSAVNCDLKHLEDICQALISSRLDLKFSALAIPRKGMDAVMIEKMKRAGFQRLEYGIESGSDKVLRSMHKIFTVEDAETAIRLTHEAGITTVIYLITGFPGEGEEEFSQTLEFLKKNAQYIDLVKSANPLYLMAGSGLYKNYREYGISLPLENPDFKWYIDENNNYQIRLDRVHKIRQVLKESGIKYFSEDDQFEKKLERKEDLRPQNEPLDMLLVTLPPWGVENPPIGLGYLDAYIRSKGLKSAVYDFNIYFHNCAADGYKMLWHVENKNYWSNEKTFPAVYKLFQNQIDYAVKKISSTQANLIGFSVVDPKERITIEVIKRVRKAAPEKKIILGGPACSTPEQRDCFADNIPGGIDYFVVGEGEETLYEIVQRKREVSNGGLAGLAYKVNGGWRTISRKPIAPLDLIPFPDYRSFDLNQYVAKSTVLVEWSRGCLGRCSFCKNYRLVGGYRRRSPEHVLEELAFLKNNYKVDTFTVCDNLMNGDIQQLEGICEGMIKHNLQMRWSGQVAPRHQMRGQLFDRMRRAGCFKVQIGVESGSEKVLKLMKKPYLPQTAAENIKAAKSSGMETEIFLLVGFPGETEREFRRTIDFIKRSSRYIDTIKSINTLHLIAGTEIYEKPESFNLAALPKNNWHYLWETKDGNTYASRKRRVEELLKLVSLFGIKVQETNIKEGKEISLSAAQGLSEEENVAIFKNSLISLQELPTRRRIFRKKRNAGKWFLLIFSVGMIFFYIIYFWLSMLLRSRIILGGKKE